MAGKFDAYLKARGADVPAADPQPEPAPQGGMFADYLKAKSGAAPTEDTAEDTPGSAPIDLDSEQESPAAHERRLMLEAKHGHTDALLRGAARQLPADIAPNLTAAVGATKDALTSPVDWGTAYDGWQSTLKRNDAEAHEARPVDFNIGRGVSMLAQGGLMSSEAMPALLKVSAADSVPATMGKMALSSGVDAAGRSEGDLWNRTIETLKGAGLGALAGALVKGAAAIAGGSEAAEKFANRRAVKALAPILSQQEMLARKDLVDKLGQSLRDEGVVRFGSSVEDMLPRVEEFLAKKGAEIGAIRSAADAAHAVNGRPGVDLSELGAIAQQGKEAAKDATSGIAARAQSYADEAARLAPRPYRTVAEAQDLASQLAEDIPYSAAKDTWTAAQKAAADLRGDIVAKSEQAIKSAVSPEDFARYQALKEQFGLFKDANKILDKSVARASRNGDFGLRDGLAATAAAGRGDTAGAAKGVVAAIASKLARERGNSALASSAGALSYILKPTSYVMNSKFGDVLRNAASAGLPKLYLMHKQLLADPDYAAMVNADMNTDTEDSAP